MTDPQAAAPGSPAEDPAPRTSPNPSLEDYQFSSRKERRIAEMTGMIPIIVPGEKSSPNASLAPADDSVVASENVPAVVALDPQPQPGVASPVTAVQMDDAGNSPSPQTLRTRRVAPPVPAAVDSQVTLAQLADNDLRVEADAEDSVAAEVAEEGVQARIAKPVAASAIARPVADNVQGGAAQTAPSATSTVPSVATADTAADVLADSSPTSARASKRRSRRSRSADSASQVPAGPAIPLADPDAVVDLEELPRMAAQEKPMRTPKAGRDLPAAISVGVVLLVLVLGTMLFFPLGFVGVASIFAAVGVWEVSRAIEGKGIKTPLTPVMVGTLAMPAAAYFGGPEGLLFALVVTCGATLLWRSLDSEEGAMNSILSGIFVLMWIPFLLGFVFLMIRGNAGPVYGFTTDLTHINPGVLQVVLMLILVVANDTFGYLVGVLFGKHPMAPKISPKKSWEGFAGSMGGAILVGVPASIFLLNENWWIGIVLAVGMVLAGTGGDFSESMIKRELGIKDMSNLLPGHGGVMDRLDSILFAAPVAYVIFEVFGRF